MTYYWYDVMYIGNHVNRSIFCGQTFGLLLNYLEVRYTGILERKYLTEKKENNQGNQS